ncbi:MAG: MAPEG family protein [Sphingomonadales bacterium]|nr:MAPEG family protein [Sphingomonadales bacterium]MBK6490764.1 MAPEG family protein [Sphingomonadales bacterium]MBK6719281.1 MAPEG family protein [Sphingomonadales bacterium]
MTPPPSHGWFTACGQHQRADARRKSVSCRVVPGVQTLPIAGERGARRSMADEYTYVVIVSALALLAYYFTLLTAGLARVRFKIEAPSHSGPPEYERYVRAHHNTLEHLVLFLPGMWLFASVVSPLWAAGIGAIWPFMRVLYALGYHKAPEKRLIPLYISMPPIYVFVLGSLIGGIVRLGNGG